MVALFQVILGAVQLLMGRKIFWLMVGIAGFLSGLWFALNWVDWSGWMKLLLALAVGIVGAGLTVVIQKPIAAIFGFFAFGVAGSILAGVLGVERGGSLYWIIFGACGLVGAILTIVLFDWALILATSLLGASSIMTGLSSLLDLSLDRILAMILFLVLLAIGIGTQSRSLKRD